MEWLNLTEWGKLHGLSAGTVRRFIANGLIAKESYIHVGRTYRIAPDAVIASEQVKIKVPHCTDFMAELEKIKKERKAS